MLRSGRMLEPKRTLSEFHGACWSEKLGCKADCRHQFVFWCLRLRCPKKNAEPLVCLGPCILLSYALGVHALNPIA